MRSGRIEQVQPVRGGGCLAAGGNARPAGQPTDLLQQRPGAELAGEFRGPLQPGGRRVPVPALRSGVGTKIVVGDKVDLTLDVEAFLGA